MATSDGVAIPDMAGAAANFNNEESHVDRQNSMIKSVIKAQFATGDFYTVNEIVTRRLGHVPIVKGDFHQLPRKVQRFVAEKVDLMRPRGIFICDGSQHEADDIIHKLVERGMLSPLRKYRNNFICRTDPKDVARVESKTWIVSDNKYDIECKTDPGVKPIMGHWMSPDVFNKEVDSRFPGCMAGRFMYVIPFSMGPVGSPLSKIGVQLTDSNYVVLCMRIMTRISPRVFEVLGDKEFVRCIHSVGLPRPVMTKIINHWPCNPDKVIILHKPDQREIWSFGSGYGGNSLLGKKCFALRIASHIARDEGWLAEHMLIMGVTNPAGKERFFAAAFPSACGKTNLAMMQPTLPGWKVRCVGDDIAWMRFDKEGQLRAINPEAGFFGVAPGTNHATNPMAMECFQENSIFTNVAETADGQYFWEGLENEVDDKNVKITNWLGQPWNIGAEGRAAHPNSRFTCPASQCPIIHPKWQSPEGVPIDAIIFGGRRPEGVPLVFESFDWAHGVFVGASLKSESTAAAEYVGKVIMHDPMAMRPFMGYNFGKYLDHWLSLEHTPNKMPKIFHVNWFRKTPEGKFLWPGFGDNIRVLEWMCKRLDGEKCYDESPIGYLPNEGGIDLNGLSRKPDMKELLSVPKQYWMEDAKEISKFLTEQVGPDLPERIGTIMKEQETRIGSM